ncbi:SPJ_0845 family protein [Lactobacillus agrestimuris]|nr:SPJ_0845 family protein [Lactobacillus agrestimuris]
MGLSFNNPNNLNKMLDKFATVPDPKKTPKKPKSNDIELESKDKKDKKK